MGVDWRPGDMALEGRGPRRHLLGKEMSVSGSRARGSETTEGELGFLWTAQVLVRLFKLKPDSIPSRPRCAPPYVSPLPIHIPYLFLSRPYIHCSGFRTCTGWQHKPYVAERAPEGEARQK